MSIKRISDLPSLPTDQLVKDGALDNTLFEISQRDSFDQVFKSFSIKGNELLEILIQAIVNIAIGNGQVNLTDVVYTNDKIHDQNITARKIFTVEQLFNGGLQVRNSGLQLFGESSSLKFNPDGNPNPKAMLSNVVITGDEFNSSYNGNNGNYDPNPNRSLANVQAIGEYIDSKGYITNDDIASLVGDINGLQTLAAILNKNDLDLYIDYYEGVTIDQINNGTVKYVLVKTNSSLSSHKIPLKYTISADKKSATFKLLYFKNIQDAIKFANKFKFLEQSKLTIYICRDMPIKALKPTIVSAGENAYTVTNYDIEPIYISHPDLIVKQSLTISGSRYYSITNQPSIDGNYPQYKIENDQVILSSYDDTSKNYYPTLGQLIDDEDIKKIFFQGYLATVSNKSVFQCSNAVNFKNLIFDGFNGRYNHREKYDKSGYYTDLTYYLIAMSTGGVLGNCIFQNLQTPLVICNANINGVACENCRVGLIGSSAGYGNNIITEYACTSCGTGISLNGATFSKSNHYNTMYLESETLIEIQGAGKLDLTINGYTNPVYLSSINDTDWVGVFNNTDQYKSVDIAHYKLPEYQTRNIFVKLSADTSENISSIANSEIISMENTDNGIQLTSFQNYHQKIFNKTPDSLKQFNNYLDGGFLHFTLIDSDAKLTNKYSGLYLQDYTQANDLNSYEKFKENAAQALHNAYTSIRYFNCRRGYGLSSMPHMMPVEPIDFTIPNEYTGACPEIGVTFTKDDPFYKYAAWVR